MNKSLLKKRIDVAAKRQQADIVIKNGKVVDVFNKEIMEKDIAIVDGVIAGIGAYEGKEVIDAEGNFIVPGFIDGHVHIESAMVTPAEFSNVVLPHGVTSVIADPHEIGNVSGTDGVQFMIDASKNVPLNVFFGIPSCVPATEFENAGAKMLADDIRPFYEQERVVSLGEIMDFPAVFHANDAMLDKLLDAEHAGKIVDGHAAGIDADGINVYRAAGILSDHECTTREEAKERLQRGMHLMLREGSASRDLKELLYAVTEENARRCLFVTDDKHLDEILDEGSINHNVRMAIDHGLKPITAIQMATLNAAEYFGLKSKGAIAPGFDADLLFLKELDTIDIQEVFVGGASVAKNGKCHQPSVHATKASERITDSIRMKKVTKEDLQIKLEANNEANIITIIPNSIVTKHDVKKVDVIDGYFQPSVKNDFLKIAVIERHHEVGNIGLGILHGLNLTDGAIASTFAHDSHNIIVAGTNDEDILLAIEEIERINGGLVAVKDGKLISSLPLAYSGLISDLDYQSVYERLNHLNKALLDLGFTGNFNPFIALSFMALPVIPEIKITDIGLFDVRNFKHIPIEVETSTVKN